MYFDDITFKSKLAPFFPVRNPLDVDVYGDVEYIIMWKRSNATYTGCIYIGYIMGDFVYDFYTTSGQYHILSHPWYNPIYYMTYSFPVKVNIYWNFWKFKNKIEMFKNVMCDHWQLMWSQNVILSLNTLFSETR